MNWLRTSFTALSFVPIAGVVGQFGNMYLDYNDPSIMKDKRALDWSADVAGALLCVFPGGGLANGAVKATRLGLMAVDKGSSIVYAGEGVKDIYQNGFSAGSVASIFGGAAGHGKFGQIAGKASEYTGMAAVAENSLGLNQQAVLAPPTEKELEAKREFDDMVRTVRKEEAEKAEAEAKAKLASKEKDSSAGFIAAFVALASIFTGTKEPAKSVGNQIDGAIATNLDTLVTTPTIAHC